jgi:hypothetical protein
VILNGNVILVQKPAHNLKGLELTTANSNQQFGREEFAAGNFIPTRTQEAEIPLEERLVFRKWGRDWDING